MIITELSAKTERVRSTGQPAQYQQNSSRHEVMAARVPTYWGLETLDTTYSSSVGHEDGRPYLIKYLPFFNHDM